MDILKTNDSRVVKIVTSETTEELYMQAMEEVSELLVALNKDMRISRRIDELQEGVQTFQKLMCVRELEKKQIFNQEMITEEIADVLVCLSELVLYLGIKEDKIIEIMDKKLNRQIGRIEQKESEK